MLAPLTINQMSQVMNVSYPNPIEPQNLPLFFVLKFVYKNRQSFKIKVATDDLPAHWTYPHIRRLRHLLKPINRTSHFKSKIISRKRIIYAYILLFLIIFNHKVVKYKSGMLFVRVIISPQCRSKPKEALCVKKRKRKGGLSSHIRAIISASQ